MWGREDWGGWALTFDTEWHDKEGDLFAFIVRIEGEFLHVHHTLPCIESININKK